MDFIIPDEDIVDRYEHILRHLFYHLLDYDYRDGLFTDESSIYDMGGTGLSDEDYSRVASTYRQEVPPNLSYTASQKFYFKLLNQEFDNMIASRFEKTYNFKLDPSIHLLKDLALLLNSTFPDRNWTTENLFISRQLDTKRERNAQEKASRAVLDTGNVTKLPVRKKPSPDEILGGVNDYLMVTVLGMSQEDADALAKLNYEKRTEGKKFEPYDPLNESTASMHNDI